jgi:hypothetical protein
MVHGVRPRPALHGELVTYFVNPESYITQIPVLLQVCDVRCPKILTPPEEICTRSFCPTHNHPLPHFGLTPNRSRRDERAQQRVQTS